ncbi:hypothetical protein C5167_032790 [Papaver somniferum]|uniref:Ribosomal RNA-processing protein 17 n=1 Tax=Papaver somniferum TaxID=3469 RepID=A0A4Y7KCJ1_PAPSO|nr:ribosomal RNA-processing protein 17-like [Papaver somniferum]RZC69655.1 hypothetical protein C5167_032790 [Papaver somniferum]
MREEKEVVAIGQPPSASGKHIKKRALRNKALSVGFNDKDLKDYVTGFHKRKKKRRKEAQHQIQEKERRLRIENRKKRKLDREYVQFGGARPADEGSEPDENGDDLELNEETELSAPLSGLETYDNGDVTIIVKTSEISREDDVDSKEKTRLVPKSSETDKKHSIPVKRKPLKNVGKGKRRSTPKTQKKRDKRAGKKKTRN